MNEENVYMEIQQIFTNAYETILCSDCDENIKVIKNVINRNCLEESCMTRASFNMKNEKRGMYCREHKKLGMVDVIHKNCAFDGCYTRPTFNNKGEKGGMYCREHKELGMVDVVSKTCFNVGCETKPTYNNYGESAKFCSEHKKFGMVDVFHKTCSYDDCKIQPIYNKRGEKRGLYCYKHKENGMINVKDKCCIYDGCETRPIYNKKGKIGGLYCYEHKEDGMVNVKDQLCACDGCETLPVYNKNGEKKGLYCYEHKEDGMVNVITKTCNHYGCETRPVYNKTGEKKGKFCYKHKQENMIDVVHKTCKSEWCSTRVHGKYDGYCLFCYMNLFPEKPVSRNYKTKEYAVVEFVKTQNPDYLWISDKTITGGCSRRRPDLLLDLGYQIIIIEVDENQHTDYDCSCENKRIMELSQDLGHRPIVFIRFNPDDYDKNENIISSCWGKDNKGFCVVKKSKMNEWLERLHILEHHIQYWLNPTNITNKTIEVIHLFYDE